MLLRLDQDKARMLQWLDQDDSRMLQRLSRDEARMGRKCNGARVGQNENEFKIKPRKGEKKGLKRSQDGNKMKPR